MKIKPFTHSPCFALNGGFTKIANNQVFHDGFTDARAIIAKPIEVNLPPGIDNSVKVGDIVCTIVVIALVVGAVYYVHKIHQEEEEDKLV